MKLTGNALSMLLKRYRAVLGKCRTLNWLAGAVLAGGIMLGATGGALAAEATPIDLSTWSSAITKNTAGTYTISPGAKPYKLTATGNNVDGLTLDGQQVILNIESGTKFIGSEAAESSSFDDLIYVKNGATVIINGGVEFSGNTSGVYGVITISNSGGNLKITGTGNVFKNNSATAVSGCGGAIAVFGNLTLTGGLFEGNNAYSESDGGRVYSSEGEVLANTQGGGGAIFLGAVSDVSIKNISNVQFVKNTTQGFGGAISTRTANVATNKNAVLTLDSVKFDSNSAAQRGGAIYTGFYANDKNPDAGVTINNSTFTGNQAGLLTKSDGETKLPVLGSGGAIYNDGAKDKAATKDSAIGSGNQGGILTITGGEFIENTATASGGAIYSSGALLTIQGGTVFTGNKALNPTGLKDSDGNVVPGRGGAIYFGEIEGIGGTAAKQMNGGNEGANVPNNVKVVGNISNATFRTNQANMGGAIMVRGGGNPIDVTISKSNFYNNSATNGGAIGLGLKDSNQKVSVTVTGGTFDQNTADENGGAIMVFRSNKATPTQGNTSLSVTGATFTSNTAASGGAIGVYDKATIVGGKFEGNKATETSNDETPAGGGAIVVGSFGTLNISGGTQFIGNKANYNGGAIGTRTFTSSDNANGRVNINGATFSGNYADAQGGAIYNAFIGMTETNGTTPGMVIANATFSDNWHTKDSNGNYTPNDVYNVGNLHIGAGVTNFLSGYIQGAGYTSGTPTIAVRRTGSTPNEADGKMLTIESGATLNTVSLDIKAGTVKVIGTLNVTGNVAEKTGGITLYKQETATAPIISLAGGTLSATATDFVKLKQDTTTQAVTGVEWPGGTNAIMAQSNKPIGVNTSGTLLLDLDGLTYTTAALTSANDVIFSNAAGATVGFINAKLSYDKATQQLAVTSEVSGSTATLTASSGPQVGSTGTTFGGNSVPGGLVADNVVNVIGNTSGAALSGLSTIKTSSNTFTAAALNVGGNTESVTLEIAGTDASKLTFTSVNGGIVVSGANNTPVKETNINIGGNGAAQVNLGIASYDADRQQFDLNKVTLNNSSAALSAINSTVDIATLVPTAGTFFIDPAYVNVGTVSDADKFGTALLVGSGSTVNLGDDAASISAALKEYNINLPASMIPTSTDISILAIGKALQLVAGSGKVVVDPGVQSDGTLDDGSTAKDAHFGKGSVLVFDAQNPDFVGTGAKPVISAASSATQNAFISKDAVLVPYNVQGPKAGATEPATVTILSGFSKYYTDAPAVTGSITTDTTATPNLNYYDGTSNVAVAGWDGKIQNPDRLLNTNVVYVPGSPSIVQLQTGLNSRSAIEQNLPGLDGELVTAMIDTWSVPANDLNSPDKGIQFLSRAANRDYIADNALAAQTIEGAARMVTIGAVPQMTRTANQAAAEAVTQRTSMAIPSSIQTQQATDKVALWIMPLYQSTNGARLDAGNFDADYHGGLGGIALGADYTFANAIRAGIAFNIGAGYATGGGDFADTTNNMNFWGLGAYAGWTGNNIGVSADVNFTSAYNKLSQDLPQSMGMRDLKADVRSYAFSTGLRGEYKLETSAVDITPHVGVRFMYLTTDNYDVKSQGTVLKGDGLNQNIWTFPIGVSFSKNIETSNGWHVKPMLDLAVVPAAGDIKAKENVRFSGTDYKAELETQVMDYITYQGVLGVEVGNENLTFGLSGNTQFGEKTSGYGVLGSFRYEF